MKLFNAIAAAAVIGASFITATPAEARNGWREAACDYENDCLYMRKTSKTGNIVKFETKLTGSDVYDRTGNCYTWQVNQVGSSNMKDVMPGTLIESALEMACR